MQTAVAHKSAVRSVAARPAARSARASRSAVVVRASAQESRRAVLLSGLLAGVAIATPSSAFAAATPVDLFDDRKAKANGFDIIYEARDLALPQETRDGFTAARTNVAETVKRVKESEKRIDSELAPFIQKQYWTEAREELRRQVGTLRFDLDVLVQSKAGKEEKKKGKALKKDFISAVEALDLSLRKKSKDAADKALPVVQTKLDAALGYLL